MGEEQFPCEIIFDKSLQNLEVTQKNAHFTRTLMIQKKYTYVLQIMQNIQVCKDPEDAKN